MASLLDPTALTEDQIELIEKMSMRFVYQAIRDFALEAVYIFANSPDDQSKIITFRRPTTPSSLPAQTHRLWMRRSELD